MKDGVAAIFGPMSSLSAAHVQSICDAMEIPHVETRWDFRENRDFYAINLYPYYRTLSRAFIDLINHWSWTTFTILYETNEGTYNFVTLTFPIIMFLYLCFNPS